MTGYIICKVWLLSAGRCSVIRFLFYERLMIMRKTIALALAALMLLSLCACGVSETKLNELQSKLNTLQISINQYESSLTGQPAVQSAEDFIWNEKTEAWFILPTNVTPDMLLVSGALGAMCQVNGWTYERKEVGPLSGTTQSLIKAATASGDVGAIIYTTLSDYLIPFVQDAADAGIIVLCLAPESPAPVAGGIDIPYAQIGTETVAAITDWCSRTDYEPPEGERLPVAVNIYGSGDATHPLSTALLDAIDGTDILFKSRLGVTVGSEDIFQAAFLWARAMMESVPDLRIFCCDTPQAAYGVCYYLEQYAADMALDLADFCVIWCGEDEDSETYLSVAREDDSYTAARGYVTWGDDGWTTGSRLGCQLLGIAYGTELPASLDDTYLTLRENHVTQPEIFGGWEWGARAFCGVTAYASFAESEDGVLARAEMPLSDVVNLIPTDEEAPDTTEE